MTKADELYQRLEAKIQSFESHFLGDYIQRSNTDPNLEFNETDLHAYSVLSHAALEGFFEDVSNFLLEESVNYWLHKQRAVSSLLCLLAHYVPKDSERNRRRREEDRLSEFLTERIHWLKNKHADTIEQNHGIKLKDIHNLFGPIGIDSYQDPMLSGTLDTFGNYRGDVAHKATTLSANRQYTPHNVKEWIDDCLKLAALIRNEVNKLLRDG